MGPVLPIGPAGPVVDAPNRETDLKLDELGLINITNKIIKIKTGSKNLFIL
jgi:hypothetical protein